MSSGFRERRIGIACALGGFLLIGAVLAPSLAGRKAFLPADYWLYTVPFALTAPPELRHFPSNTLLGDQATIYAPQFWVVRKGLRQGALPLWNPYFRAGEPMLGTGLAGPLAPTNLPILLLPWPLGHAWAAWLRFGLAWMGAYLFARALRLGRGWSLALAVCFCFAPGFIVHFQQQPRAVAHMGLPWLLWGAERLAAAAGLRAQLRSSLALVAIVLATLVAGYPPAEWNVLFAGACYLALRLPWRPLGAAMRSRVVAACALLAGALLAAPVLLPFADFLQSSATFADRTDQGQWVLPAEVYRLLWDPMALGSPLRFATRPWSGAYNFEDEQVYIGLVPWLFLAVGAVRLAFRRARVTSEDALRIAAFATIAVIAASLGLGWPPLHGWLTRVPPFTYASNPRMLFLAQVAVPVLAALIWRSAATPRDAAPTRLGIASGLLALCALGTIATTWLALHEQWDLRPWLVLATAASLLAADRLAASSRERRAVISMLPIVVLADLAPVYAGYHPQVPRAWANPARVEHVLPPPLAADPAPRVAFESFAAPNLSALYGVVDIRGYGYPVPLRYDAYMREVTGLANPATLEPAELRRPEVIAAIERTCARWLLTSLDYDAGWNDRLERVWERGRLRLYALRDASPCATWHATGEVAHRPDLATAVVRLRDTLMQHPEPIVLEEAGEERDASAPLVAGVAAVLERPLLGRIEVVIPEAAVSRAGWIVVRESYDPGWRAASDRDEPLRVVPAQVRFLAVEVPAGTRRVVMEYTPTHARTGAALAAVALAAVAATQLWARRA
jgi:hypothetical protein